MFSLSSSFRRLPDLNLVASAALVLGFSNSCGGKSERVLREGSSAEASHRDRDTDKEGEPSPDGHDGDRDQGDSDGDDLPPVYDRSRAGTCARWNADTSERGEGTWNGDVRECEPGDVSTNGRENALRVVNLHRWLADLPPVETSDERNELAQECALLQEANWRERGLSHVPRESWKCYSEAGAQGAITSNLSTGPGVLSVPAYFLELGNQAAMGHRRIILSNELGPIGLGATGPGGASCLQALPGTMNAARAWVAWPPPGVFPLAAYEFARRSLSETGWSIQSDYIDLSGAKVLVTSGRRALDVEVAELEPSAGSKSAIRIVPNGWTVHAGETYVVSVTGIRPTIEYEVEIVDCSSD
ncbi:MAG TPA: hypothetical protein VGK73_22315 [Polyangiaceae bacterium]